MQARAFSLSSLLSAASLLVLASCASKLQLGPKQARELETMVFADDDGMRAFRRHLARASGGDARERERAFREAMHLVSDERASVEERAAVLRDAALVVEPSDLDAVAGLFSDPALAEAALFVIERVPGEEASKLLAHTVAAADHGGGADAPRLEAEAVLAAIARRDADETTLAVLRRNADHPRFGAQARRALAHAGDPASEAALARAVTAEAPGAASTWLLWLERRQRRPGVDGGAELWAMTAAATDPLLRRAAFEHEVQQGDPIQVAMQKLGTDDPRCAERVRGILVAASEEALGERLRDVARGHVDVVTKDADPAALARRARAAAIHILVERKDPRSDEFVDAALAAADSDAANVAAVELRDHVLTLLAEAPRDADADHYRDLLERPEPAVRDVGAKALVAIATRCDPVVARDLASAVLAASVSNDATRAALALVEKAPDASCLPTLRSKWTALRADAAASSSDRAAAEAALLATAAVLEDEAQARELAREVALASEERAVRARAARLYAERGGNAGELGRQRGCLSTWHIAGPFEAPVAATFTKLPFEPMGLDPDKPLVYATANGTGSLAWVAKSTDDIDGVVDLRFLSKQDKVSALARSVIVTREAVQLELRCGSDDQLAIWLDGRLIHENFSARGLRPDEDRIPIDLAAGKHELVLRIGQEGGGWEFCARVVPR